MDLIVTIAPVFLLMALGALLRVFRIADDRWVEVLNNFALYAGFPALIFSNLTSLETGTSVNYSLFLYNSLVLLAVFVSVLVITNVVNTKPKIRNCYIVGIIFGNTAYLGFPYISALIPGSGSEIAIIIASYIFIVFTAGLWVLESSLDEKASIITILKNISKSSLLISVVIGIVFARFEIFVPNFIGRAISMLADAASPVVLIALGIFIVRKIELSKKLVHAVAISALKLVALPAVFVAVNCCFFKETNQASLILEAGMPTAVTMFALSQKYPIEKTVTVYIIVISTIVSMITLPLLTVFIL
ncbi:MAG: AEC family transporter [Proteobacteria bacterium]|nr:AEC family transporter [Pseudomonadota bacterium]